ncbi:MAG: hypothetical protein FWD61_19760 [Phycisphaerales bacterium]|nr:hypothetical protein [Phycisphaerales bacterium]
MANEKPNTESATANQPQQQPQPQQTASGPAPLHMKIIHANRTDYLNQADRNEQKAREAANRMIEKNKANE